MIAGSSGNGAASPTYAQPILSPVETKRPFITGENKMHLYRFTDDDGEAIVSAPSQLKAIEIYEGNTGDLPPSQMYGSIEFALEPGTDTGLAV